MTVHATDTPSPADARVTAPLEVPVLDLSTMRRADGSFDPAFLERLRFAAHNVGFFQIVGYGAEPGQVDALFRVTAEFFARPEAEKLALHNQESPHYRGYSAIAAERTQGRPDSREQLDFSADREPIPAERIGEGEEFWHLQGRNQWPAGMPELERTAMAWTALMDRVGEDLLKALCVAIGLDEDHFSAAFDGDRAWMAKLAHYVGGVAEAGTQGVGLHADYGFITLLLQDEVGGLEVRPYGQDAWLPVEPIPGALVVNLGEMLEVATDGYLMATIHRVQSPPPGVDRYSVPFFYSPRLDAVIEKVELPAELAADARGVSDDPTNPMLASFGSNMLKGFARAHPRVTERFHPGLLNR
ncbi:isopenicillin N synthase family oxygenase [Micrococcus sp. EYE_162]|uniref:isopenicillin N synthase family dioxygenase n=1 Tax=unclassified Micrococcus TaxID=2620948 RepID=UPI00200376BE|nr:MULTISPECIES: 2-oxoglutarate and iron-dependent oxygenase domain-containing protein [unclassified Micrococcus]MCK6095456.1 isopenicillin N synthase family oxygenase [Micrococcus sp. EYE_212]MCK6171531.1 isopenicillin N synthase family oxygenase [Micrococcus sp. EYE_162]